MIKDRFKPPEGGVHKPVIPKRSGRVVKFTSTPVHTAQPPSAHECYYASSMAALHTLNSIRNVRPPIQEDADPGPTDFGQLGMD